MPRRVTFPAVQIKVAAVLRDLGSESISRITAALPPVVLRFAELQEILAKANVAQSEDAARMLFSFATLVLADSPNPPKSVFEDIDATLADRWSAEEMTRWRAIEPALIELVTASGLATLAKTVRLQYDHTNMLTETHVVTDVRPVFDADASQALAAIICHTLRISFRSEDRTHHLTLALDTQDLERLGRDIARALSKAKVMTDFLADPRPLPTRIAGGKDGT